MPSAEEPLGARFFPLIAAVMRGLGAAGDDTMTTRIASWLDLLVTWNAKVDLTAARSADELVDLMLADAVVIARHEPHASTIVDVGSGAGGPGLALHLIRPDLAVTLVEPREKRVSFLRSVAGQLPPAAPGGDTTGTSEAGSLRIERAKGEDVARRGASFHSAIARAVLPPDAWLRLGVRLAGVSVWVLLAREEPPHLADWEIDVDERYRWPLTSVDRRAIRYRRKTPAR